MCGASQQKIFPIHHKNASVRKLLPILLSHPHYHLLRIHPQAFTYGSNDVSRCEGNRLPSHPPAVLPRITF